MTQGRSCNVNSSDSLTQISYIYFIVQIGAWIARHDGSVSRLRIRGAVHSN